MRFAIVSLLLSFLLVNGQDVVLEDAEMSDYAEPSPILVPRVSYTGAPEDFAKWLSSHSEPVIVDRESAPTESMWGSRTIPWTPEFLVESIPQTVIRAKNDTDSKFLWGCCNLKNYYLAQYFEKVKQVEATDGKEFVYFSSEMEKLGQTAGEFFISGIWPLELVQIEEIKDLKFEDFKHLVWLGSKGVTTPFHFDEMHNVFLQVYGQKRFTLLPPTAWNKLYLYPKFHIRHRNVQLPEFPLPQELFSEFPLYEYTTAIPQIADLNPGDVLYLPPLWFHQVEALSTSISVNVWSPVKNVETIMKAWEEPIPVNYAEWSAVKVTLLTNYFIQILVQTALKLDNYQDAEMFIRQVTETRYRRLYDEFLDIMDDPDEDWEPSLSKAPRLNLKSMERKEHQAYMDSLKDSPPLLYMDLANAMQLCSSYQILETKSEEVKAIYDQARKTALIIRQGDPGLVQIYLANYIEDLAAQFVGEKAIFPYMKYCAASWVNINAEEAEGGKVLQG
jgi:hypothetical protein